MTFFPYCHLDFLFWTKSACWAVSARAVLPKWQTNCINILTFSLIAIVAHTLQQLKNHSVFFFNGENIAFHFWWMSQITDNNMWHQNRNESTAAEI